MGFNAPPLKNQAAQCAAFVFNGENPDEKNVFFTVRSAAFS